MYLRPLDSPTTPIEAYDTPTWHVEDWVSADVGPGTDLASGFGAARWRVLIGVSLEPHRRRPNTIVAHEAPVAPRVLVPVVPPEARTLVPPGTAAWHRSPARVV